MTTYHMPGNKADGLTVAFDSIADLIAHCEDRKARRHDDWNDGSSDRTTSTWDCNAGWNGALKLARDGWQLPGKHAAVGMMATPQGSIEFAESGDEVDAGLFIAGEPECFIQRVGEVPFRAERILANIGYNCFVDSEDIARRSALLWDQILKARSDGVDCQIDCIWVTDDTCGNDDRLNVFTVSARHIGDPVESHGFMAAFHPAVFRRLLFRANFNACKTPMMAHGKSIFDLYDIRPILGDAFKGCRYIATANYDGEPIEKLPTL